MLSRYLITFFVVYLASLSEPRATQSVVSSFPNRNEEEGLSYLRLVPLDSFARKHKISNKDALITATPAAQPVAHNTFDIKGDSDSDITIIIPVASTVNIEHTKIQIPDVLDIFPFDTDDNNEDDNNDADDDDEDYGLGILRRGSKGSTTDMSTSKGKEAFFRRSAESKITHNTNSVKKDLNTIMKNYFWRLDGLQGYGKPLKKQHGLIKRRNIDDEYYDEPDNRKEAIGVQHDDGYADESRDYIDDQSVDDYEE